MCPIININNNGMKYNTHLFVTTFNVLALQIFNQILVKVLINKFN